MTGDRADRLARALRPRAVAVIGASPRPGALSGRFVGGLRRHGYPGRIVPVNPNHEEVLGYACVPSIGDAGEIDLAVLSVPRRMVQETLEACADAGVAGAAIFASGYSETGEAGRTEERAITDLARRTGMRVIGPNGPGFINATDRCCVIASGVSFRERLTAGGVAVVAQSGGVAGLLVERAQDRGIGISKAICTGNEADVTVGDVLGFLARDDATLAVAIYMEAVRDGVGFLAGLAAMRAAGKGVVVLKVGSTEAGARASAAHTGALASDDDIVTAALDAHRAVRVTAFDELIEAAALIAVYGPAASPAIGIVSTSGGAGVVATEAAERAGLILPPFSAATQERLAAAGPDFASPANPADMSGMFVEDPEIFRGSLSAVLDEPAVEAAVLVLTVHPPELSEELARRTIEVAMDARRPLIVQWTAGAMSAAARRLLRDAGVPVIEDAGLCMEALAARARAGRPTRPPLPVPDVPAPDLAAARAAGAATEYEALQSLAVAGVPIARTLPVRVPEEAVAAADEIGFPVVLKASARDLLHKSDAGAVIIGVADADAAHSAFTRVVAAARSAGADVDGVIVQEQARPGLELIVGVRREPELGLCLVAGLGGVQAELLGDVSRRLLPLGTGESRAMLDELRLAPLLHGHRGRPGVDLDAVAGAIEGIAALAAALGPDLDAIEVNPLVAHPDGVTAVDALLLFRTGGS